MVLTYVTLSLYSVLRGTYSTYTGVSHPDTGCDQ